MKFIVISVPAFVSHEPLMGEGLTTTVAAAIQGNRMNII
jgi:hypothetical protein